MFGQLPGSKEIGMSEYALGRQVAGWLLSLMWGVTPLTRAAYG